MSLQQILAAVRTKYAHLGLSEAVLLQFAQQILAGVTAEGTTEQVDAELLRFEPMARTLQSDADRIRTETAARAKADAERGKQQPPKADSSENANNQDAPPSWFSSWSKQNDERLTNLEGKQTRGTREQQLAEVLAGANDSFKTQTSKSFARMNFKDEQDFLAYLEEIKADVVANPKETAKAENENSDAQQQSQSMNFVPGGGATKGKAADAKSVDAGISAWAAQNGGQEAKK